MWLCHNSSESKVDLTTERFKALVCSDKSFIFKKKIKLTKITSLNKTKITYIYLKCLEK